MVEPILAAQDAWFSQGGTTVKRTSITQIEIKDTYTPTGTVTSSWDASAAKDGSVKAYVEGTKLTIAGNGSGKVYANPDSKFAFSSSGSDKFSNLTAINSGNLLDTSKATNMQQMFSAASSLKTVDTSNWNTSNVTNMLGTFYEARALETVNVSNWDTSKVETTYLMFASSSAMSLQTLDVSNWDTGKVTNMVGMFQNCRNLTSLNVSNWNVGEVTSMQFMFYMCSRLTDLDVSNWNTGAVADMSYMFTGCSSLVELDVSNWDTGEVTTMAGMFQLCNKLTTLDVSDWNTGKVTNMTHSFDSCTSLKELNVTEWDTSSCNNMSYMFNKCVSLESLDVSKWNTGKVTTFKCMFQGNDYAGDMKVKPEVSNWNTSSATDMNRMFYGCGQITEMDLSKWDVSKVTTMNHMFTDCFKMTSYNFTGWNTASLTNMDGMFNDNRALVSIDVSDFDTAKVTIMSQIFEACGKLTELDLSNWDTCSVFTMAEMFSGCSNLKTIYVSDKWTTSALKDGTNAGGIGFKDSLFSGCTKLVGGAGTAFDANHTDYVYARIDGKDGNLGYLTDIDDPTQMLIQTGTLHKLGISVRGVTGDTSKYSPSDMNAALKDVRSEVTTQANLLAQAIAALEGKASGGEQVTPVISVSSNGLITATAGAKTSTHQLAFQPAKTIMPTTASQIAVSSGYYTGDNVMVAGDSNLVAGNIKSGVSIFGVSGTLVEGGGSGEAAEWSENEDAIVSGTISTYTNDRATSIGSYAFYSCSSLTTVSFPACTTIGSNAF